MTRTFKLGTGRLNWHRGERITDRYGSVGLWPETGEQTLALDEACAGVRGRLVAVVIEARRSTHIGDLFRGLGPGDAKVGDRIELGIGTVFFESNDDCRYVGLRPDDGREHDWLDPEALYRAHSQTVELIVEEIP